MLSDNGYARLLAAFAHLSPEWRAELVQAWSQPGALTGGLNYYRASPMYPATADDPGAAKLRLEAKDFMVRVPTLVLWGERDTALLTGLLDGLGRVRARPEAGAGAGCVALDRAREAGTGLQ